MRGAAFQGRLQLGIEQVGRAHEAAVRVAAAHIDYAPAFSSRSASYLWEPAIGEEGDNGLSALARFPTVNEARERIKSVWVEHIRRKTDTVLAFCATQRMQSSTPSDRSQDS